MLKKVPLDKEKNEDKPQKKHWLFLQRALVLLTIIYNVTQK